MTVARIAGGPPTPKKKKSNGDANEVRRETLTIKQPDHKFDLVLAWEHADFVPPDRLSDFAAEVSRVLVPGGWFLMYARDDPQATAGDPDTPACYRLTAEDKIVREPTSAPVRPRWTHPNRTLERALAPLAVQSIHLQRNRMREFLMRNPQRSA